MDTNNEKIVQAVISFLEAVNGRKDNKAVSELMKGMVDRVIVEDLAATAENNPPAETLWSKIDHDLRSPMCGILGFTGILLEEISDPEIRWKAEQIRIAAQKVMEILCNSNIYRYQLPDGTDAPKPVQPQVLSADTLLKPATPLKKKAKSAGKKLPNVLIVEDNSVNSNLLMHHLKKHCHLFFSQTGKAAVDLALQEKIDVIFMDINLGEGMDGIQAMLEIRKQTGNESLPIIAVTGYAGRADKENFLLAGFTDFVAKPFERQEVIGIMQNLFRQDD